MAPVTSVDCCVVPPSAPLPESIVAVIHRLTSGTAFPKASATWTTGQTQPREASIARALAMAEDAQGSADRQSPPVPEVFARLTPRELDVLRLIAAGHSDREIAAELFVSPRTVNVHVSNIFSKLGIHSRAAVTAHAIRHGLI